MHGRIIMYYLLKHMSFTLVTGFGRSTASFNNDKDSIVGQGVLQGSSSAALLFIFNSEISLKTYWSLGTGAAFYHPINGNIITDKTVQYVDDTSQLVNAMGAGITSTDTHEVSHLLHQTASKNSKIWADCMWVSSGDLNSSKCFYYAFEPQLNFNDNKITYKEISLPSNIHIFHPSTKNSHPMQQNSPNNSQTHLGCMAKP
jgi:hypothetical protein